MLIQIILLSVGYAQLEYVKEVINSLADQECNFKKRIVYGQQKLHRLSGIYFCDSYAKRTCCSQQNLEELKFKWYNQVNRKFVRILTSKMKFGKNQELLRSDNTENSNKQSNSLNNVRKYLSRPFAQIAMEILGNKQGLDSVLTIVLKCIKPVGMTYSNLMKKLRNQDYAIKQDHVQLQNDVFCSELRNIVNSGDQFCTSLGYKVNSYTDVDEWLENKYLNLSTNPLCWDGTPSHRIWGADTKLPETKVSTKSKKKSTKEEQQSYLGLIIFIVIIVILIVVSYRANIFQKK